jgi:hypothetical protein
VFRIRIWIRIDFGRLNPDLHRNADPDPDPGGQKLPTKTEKRYEVSSFEVQDVLF